MSDGMSAQGTLIARSPDPNWPTLDPVGGALNFVNIAELRDITGPDHNRNPIELTNHNKEDDEWIVGIRRKGDLQFNLNFVPFGATHNHRTGLIKAWEDGTRDIYRITYPDGSTWTFSGFVTNVGAAMPVDDRLSSDVTIRPTGRTEFVDADEV